MQGQMIFYPNLGKIYTDIIDIKYTDWFKKYWVFSLIYST